MSMMDRGAREANMESAARGGYGKVSEQAALITKLEAEVSFLRLIVVRYGDRARMSNVEDMSLQQVIDRAFAATA